MWQLSLCPVHPVLSLAHAGHLFRVCGRGIDSGLVKRQIGGTTLMTTEYVHQFSPINVEDMVEEMGRVSIV